MHVFRKPTGDLLDTAASVGGIGRWLDLVASSDFADALHREGPYTVFAPSDAAFERMASSTLDAVRADRGRLNALLKNHIVPGRLSSSDLSRVSWVRSLRGERLALTSRPGLTVNDVPMGVSDIETFNGVIHVIDEVLLPR